MAARILGLATIGQAPRDDIVPGMLGHFPKEVTVLQAGALDGICADELASMQPAAGDYVLISRLADGSAAAMGRRHVVPRLQAAVDRLEAQGASVIAVLCTGTFPDLATRNALLVEPERLFHATCAGVVSGRRLGSLIPLAAQIPQAQARWREAGVEAVVVAASPYGSQDEVAAAAAALGAADVAAIALDCFGFTEAMRAIVRRESGRPVIMANTYLARVLGELLS